MNPGDERTEEGREEACASRGVRILDECSRCEGLDEKEALRVEVAAVCAADMCGICIGAELCTLDPRARCVWPADNCGSYAAVADFTTLTRSPFT